jgi:hypothetical protein
MRHDDWFCLDCRQVRELDSHARCSSCGSDALKPADFARNEDGRAASPRTSTRFQPIQHQSAYVFAPRPEYSTLETLWQRKF